MKKNKKEDKIKENKEYYDSNYWIQIILLQKN